MRRSCDGSAYMPSSSSYMNITDSGQAFSSVDELLTVLMDYHCHVLDDFPF